MSAAWRGRPEAAIAASTLAARRIADLRGTVRVLEPPSPYALGTSDAPLLVTIGNGLPFTVRVRLEIASTSGLRVAPIEMQQVPPLGRRQARVSAQVTRSGQFTVQAAVRSPDGQLLGPPSRLRVRSTAYGTITVWLTASAGILLVVLAVRRVRRRVHDEPPPHTGPIPVAPPIPAAAHPARPAPNRSMPPPATAPPAPNRRDPVRPRPSPGGHPHGDPFPEVDGGPTAPVPLEPTMPLRRIPLEATHADGAGPPVSPAPPARTPTPPSPRPRRADDPSPGAAAAPPPTR
jgi:hypothetical protein